jgi:hypothetical protein
VALLEALYRLGYLRTDQIVAARYLRADPVPQAALLRTVQRRLRQLADAEVVRRIEQPIYRSDRRGTAPYLYSLGPLGAEWIAHHHGIDLRAIAWQPTPAERSLLFMQHALRIGDYWLALTRACAANGAVLETFVTDRLLRRAPVPVRISGDKGQDRTVQLVPDVFYALRLPTGKGARVFAEIDRGQTTIVPGLWDRRGHTRTVQAYVALAASEQLQARFEADTLWVQFVTTGEQRLQAMRSATERVGGDHRFWFSTFDQLHADLLRDAIWQVAGKAGNRFAML